MPHTMVTLQKISTDQIKFMATKLKYLYKATKLKYLYKATKLKYLYKNNSVE